MKYSRRSILKSALALPAVASVASLNPLMIGNAYAAYSADQIKQALAKYKGGSFTVSSWGGSFQESQRKAFFAPFSKEFGIRIVEDGPPKNPKIVAMVKAENVTWDLCDVGAYKSTPLGQEGILEEIDYSVIDKSDIFPGFAPKYGVGNLSYSTVLSWRNDVLTDDKPTHVKDIWDLERFPGKRGMRDSPIENLAYALQADGMAMEDIYPLNEEKIARAYKKMDEIKDHVVWWSSGAQAPQLLVNKEVHLTLAFNGRLDKIVAEGVPVGLTWNGAQLMGDAWVIPKNAPNKDLAMLFIAWACLPEINWRLSEYISYGPVNFKAIKYVSEERRKIIPTTYTDVQVSCDYDYWGDKYNAEVDRWAEWKLG